MPARGFEPRTLGLKGRCSAWLSYTGTVVILSKPRPYHARVGAWGYCGVDVVVDSRLGTAAVVLSGAGRKPLPSGVTPFPS